MKKGLREWNEDHETDLRLMSELMVERPAFAADETLVLEENMFFAVHPAAVNQEVFGAACDNFLVTAKGAERLTATPHGVLCG